MSEEMTHPCIEVCTRTDKKFAWRLTAANGNIITTDGGQGYENKSDAKDMAVKIIKDGDYADVTVWWPT